jgi:hypothetical protein
MKLRYIIGIIGIIALLSIAAIPNTIELDGNTRTLHFFGELANKFISDSGDRRVDIFDGGGMYYSYYVTPEQYERMVIGEKYLYITGPVVIGV